MAPDVQKEALLGLAAADLRLATVAHRIATAGAAICPITAPLLGLTVHDLAQYAPQLRDMAAASFLLGRGVTVLAVAPGSPADAAGLQRGDELAAIAGTPLPYEPLPPDANFATVGRTYARLEEAAAAGPVPLVVQRGTERLAVILYPVTGCVSRIQLVPGRSVDAEADGRVVSVTTALLEFAATDDELALVLSHEIAHNALGHRAMRGGRPASAADTRVTETAADRFGYYLVARAGYDLHAAPGFWERLYKGPAGGLFAPASHLGRHERTQSARRAIAEIDAMRDAGAPLTP